MGRATGEIGVAWRLDAWDYDDASHVEYVQSHAADGILKRSNRSVIVATKGMGKTRLLQLKSNQVRAYAHDGSVFIPKNEISEQFASLPQSLSKERVNLLSLKNTWRLLWSAAIASVVLYRTEERPFSMDAARLLGVDGELARDPELRRQLSIKEALTRLLNARPSEYLNVYNFGIESRLSELGVNVHVFLDGVDEAFQKHATSGVYDDTGNVQLENYKEGALSRSVWVNSQLGLLGAIRDLQHRSRNLRIYATLRREAYEENTEALEVQERDLCVELRVDKEQAERIFIANIKAMHESELANPRASDPYEQFLGVTRISRSASVTECGSGHEQVFDFIYRHTFGRPREVLAIGSALADIPVERRNERSVREKILEYGSLILRWYKQELTPPWDPTYDALINVIDRNVITEAHVVHMFEEFNRSSEKDKVKHLFSYYINRGLIGRLAYDEYAGQSIIKFAEIGGRVSNEVTVVGRTRTYFVHPCLVEEIKKHRESLFIDPRGVVSNNEPWAFGDERNTLEVIPALDKHFDIQFDGIVVSGIANGRAWPMPLFVGIAKAVHRHQRSTVNVREVCDCINLLSLSDVGNGFRKLSGDSLVQHVRKLFDESASDDSEEARTTLDTINLALTRAIRLSRTLERRSGVETAAESQGGDSDNFSGRTDASTNADADDEIEHFIRWENRSFVFDLCEPGQVRVRDLRATFVPS